MLLKNAGDVLPLAADAAVYVAGSNADDLGNQMGGWTISWQGGSGDTTTGTTILEGIQVAAGARHVLEGRLGAGRGRDVGVVVVGETPYAEGRATSATTGSAELTAADRAAIDTVCGAMQCVVLVVSGRPQLVTDQLGAIDALVASWLPGTEGAGVADVLFGTRPFTGRLPVTWPAEADQVPVNVGDATYDPQYAYGWGLRTDAPRARLDGAGRACPPAARGRGAGGARRDVWAGDALDGGGVVSARSGCSRPPRRGARRRGDPPRAGLVVSLVRDLAQAAVVRGPGRRGTTADAEHALMSGARGTPWRCSPTCSASTSRARVVHDGGRVAPSTVVPARPVTATVTVGVRRGVVGDRRGARRRRRARPARSPRARAPGPLPAGVASARTR